MENIERFQTENLFLLVGTDPLRNYVAARLLAKKNARVYLVHTELTEAVADRLIEALRTHIKHFTKVFLESESDAHAIFERVYHYAEGKPRLGINYAGGTKPMAVHAHAAVRHADPEAVCSYIDARSLHLLIDREGMDSLCWPVNLSVTLDFETLLALQGYTLWKPPVREPFHPEATRAFLTIPHEELGDWCDENLKVSSTKFQNNTTLSDVILPTDPPFDTLAPYWEESRTLGGLAEAWGVSVHRLAWWMDGRWLEEYTLDSLKRVADECQVHEMGLDFEPIERHFEFDVAAIRGWQLFAISCTTMSRKRNLKHKLFEAFIRARQMGGEGARVGVVCCAPGDIPENTPATIEREIEESWEAEGKVRVFGAEHLPNLSEHLKEWLLS